MQLKYVPKKDLNRCISKVKLKEEKEMEFCVVMQFGRQELDQSSLTEKEVRKAFWEEMETDHVAGHCVETGLT